GELRVPVRGRFGPGRASAGVDSHRQAYQRVGGLMASEWLFDVDREPARVRDRYGPTLFGRQCLAARRLVEAGVPFVRVGRAWWGSHGANFDPHAALVPELGHGMATRLDDLAARGLPERTPGRT